MNFLKSNLFIKLVIGVLCLTFVAFSVYGSYIMALGLAHCMDITCELIKK